MTALDSSFHRNNLTEVFQHQSEPDSGLAFFVYKQISGRGKSFRAQKLLPRIGNWFLGLRFLCIKLGL
ncbi:MAG: hypothetical protein DRR19_28385 [Candidatus Parabeggiatoa sp. nov. 1]|nr:MAG: hypothetical protein DRR19_28385 [Gammaproteobacteria bacterium]